MFRRKWSALPEDPQFESDFKSLGYFINKDDEIRSIENEDNYYKFFLDRNPRINDRQRFALNMAVQAELRQRLTNLGLLKLTLPLGADPSSSPNLPILVTPGIREKSRVVIIFGETHQDLGVLAHRVIDGPGGIDKGSMVSIVKALLQRRSSPTDPSPPGIILANMGELVWWPEGKRTLTRISFDWSPMRSAAHLGNYVDPEVNFIHGNENPLAHVKYIFEQVVPTHVNPDAGLDIIGLGDGADIVETYLNSTKIWNRVGERINCFASVGGQFPEWDVKCEGLRQFLKDRTRAYVPSTEPLDLILADPLGNPNTTTFTSLGCPVFSAGHAEHVEMLFITSHQIVLDWLDEVAATPPEQKPYMNPTFTILFSETERESDTWADEGKGSAETPAMEDSLSPKVAEVSGCEGNKADATGGLEDNQPVAAGGQEKAVARDDVGSGPVAECEDGSAARNTEIEQSKAFQKLVIRPKKTENADEDQEDGKP
ncbi:Arb2 domain-containing protein [Xylaria arbuscula]|nr:Arb2 domain-containing protein [Xylaria arbuscula]